MRSRSQRMKGRRSSIILILPILDPPSGIFSVALSVGLLRLDVIKHRALCSSDFPHLTILKAKCDRHCHRDAQHYTPDRSAGRDRVWWLYPIIARIAR